MPQLVPAFVALVQVAAAKITVSAVAAFALKVAAVVAIQKLTQAIFSKSGTSQGESKVNVRVATPIRWIACGEVRIGGGVVLGEYSENNNTVSFLGLDIDSPNSFWYVIANCDSPLTGTTSIYLDDVLVTLDEDNFVEHEDFMLDGKKYFQIWTTTFTEDNPLPPAVSSLMTALPTLWTDSHKFVGTTYTVVRCLPVDIEDRHKIYRWAGPLGLGEPSVSIVGQWSNVYDPRDSSHDINDSTTWSYSNNTALVWAWFRTHPFGKNRPMSEIDWDMIAEQANICDELIPGYGTTLTKRYTTNIAIADDTARFDAEKSILDSAQATIHFNDTGRAYCIVSCYKEATVTLNRDDDLLSLEIQGNKAIEESEYQGVVVRYTNPNAKYEITPCSPWEHPDRFVEGTRSTFLTVDIPSIDNHNQAYRVAKLMGQQFQSDVSFSAVTSLRALKMLNQRIGNFEFDIMIDGEFELYEPVEVDASGVFCSFVGFPIKEENYTLAIGEEPEPPSDEESTPVEYIPDFNFTISFLGGVKIDYDFSSTSYQIMFQYRVVEDGQGEDDDWVNLGLFTDQTGPPQIVNRLTTIDNAEYEVRGRVMSVFSTSIGEWVVRSTVAPISTNRSVSVRLVPESSGAVRVEFNSYQSGEDLNIDFPVNSTFEVRLGEFTRTGETPVNIDLETLTVSAIISTTSFRMMPGAMTATLTQKLTTISGWGTPWTEYNNGFIGSF